METGDSRTIRILSQRYEVRATLETGGMGTVHRVWDRRQQRELALKTIRDTADPKKLSLFLNEIRIPGSFSHPYIVDVYDCENSKKMGSENRSSSCRFCRGGRSTRSSSTIGTRRL
jgi:serine/threonine protein kinase